MNTKTLSRRHNGTLECLGCPGIAGAYIKPGCNTSHIGTQRCTGVHWRALAVQVIAEENLKLHGRTGVPEAHRGRLKAQGYTGCVGGSGYTQKCVGTLRLRRY